MARRRDAYEARFRATIALGAQTGAFAAVDPALTAAYLLSAINGLVAWYRPSGRVSAQAISEAYSDLSLRAVQAHGPARP